MHRNFEKYTIESNAICGDQQHVKHELTAEKAYLNKTELSKLQTQLYELRLNMIKSGLVSSQFCAKLARVKLESFLHDFFAKVRSVDWKRVNDPMPQLSALNSEVKILIDILCYFNRKQAKPSMKALANLNVGERGRSKGDKADGHGNKKSSNEDLNEGGQDIRDDFGGHAENEGKFWSTN